MMRKSYIIAVSGGVDSVALLHKLMTVKPPSVDYIVAHVDHGIRTDSSDDATFVSDLALQYGAVFELKNLSLGPGASEDMARIQRYEFLFEVMKKYKAESIITAHHQDDVLETMVINIIRGTSPRGLIGFTRNQIIRPFINKTKKDIYEYAQQNSLEWREDSTNKDLSYLRNYVRSTIVPKIEDRNELLAIREQVEKSYLEIDDLIKKLLVQTMHKGELVRSRFVILPVSVQQELIACWLRLQHLTFDKNLITKAVLGCKVLLPGKHLELSKTVKLYSLKKTIVIKVHE